LGITGLTGFGTIGTTALGATGSGMGIPGISILATMSPFEHFPSGPGEGQYSIYVFGRRAGTWSGRRLERHAYKGAQEKNMRCGNSHDEVSSALISRD